jgi:hypothetical protein
MSVRGFIQFFQSTNASFQITANVTFTNYFTIGVALSELLMAPRYKEKKIIQEASR